MWFDRAHLSASGGSTFTARIGARTSAQRCSLKSMRFIMIVKASAASDGGEPADGDVLVEMIKFNNSLMSAGVVRWVEALELSSRGAQVQYAAGQRTIISAPFPTPQELITGFWIIEVSSREQAVEWACRVPLVGGRVELHEVVFQILPVTYDDRFNCPR